MTTNNLSPELMLQIRKEARETATAFVDAYMKGKELECKEKQLFLQKEQIKIMHDMMVNLRYIRNRLREIGDSLEDSEGRGIADMLEGKLFILNAHLNEIDQSLAAGFHL